MGSWSPQETIEAIRRSHLVRVLAVYLGVSFAWLEAIDLLTGHVGLPDWVFTVAIALLLIGLPIVVATALVQGTGRPKAVGGEVDQADEETTVAEVAEVARGWLTWRRALLGGVLAFAVLAVGAIGYITMRSLGIGPVGSLVAAGVLDDREPIILAEFENRTDDSTLAVLATEAFRIDLSQSKVVSVIPTGLLSEALTRMGRSTNEPLDAGLAREIAIREGIKAYIRGEVGGVGESYLVSAELVLAESGEILVANRERADGASDLLAAIDRLSKKLRERIGDSLRSIRKSEPLDRVTTASLDALSRYSQAVRALDVEGDNTKAVVLLEEAIAFDTTFAMAYRLLGARLYSRGDRARGIEMFEKAYKHRDRLTDRERYLTLGTYYEYVTHEREKAMAAYSTLLDNYPDENRALLRLANLYGAVRNFAKQEELLSRGTMIDSTSALCYPCLVDAQALQGKLDAAEATVATFARNVPGHPMIPVLHAVIATARGEYEDAEAESAALVEMQSNDPSGLTLTHRWLAALVARSGRLAEAEQHIRQAQRASESAGLARTYIGAVLDLGFVNVLVRDDAERGLGVVAEALDRFPLDSIPPLDRPYIDLASLFAAAGRPQRARATLEEYERAVEPRLRRGAFAVHNALGIIALAEGRYSDAIDELRRYDEETACPICALPDLGRAYDRAGQTDSAIAVYERYLETPDLDRTFLDSSYEALTYERLASLYEQRGDPQRAAYYHGKLVSLWEGADAELQPRVESARRAIRALSSDR